MQAKRILVTILEPVQVRFITHRFAPAEGQTADEGASDRKSQQLGVLFIWE